MKSQIEKIVFYYGDNNGIAVDTEKWMIKVFRTNHTIRKYAYKSNRFNRIFNLTQLWRGDYAGIWSRTTTLTRPNKTLI